MGRLSKRPWLLTLVFCSLSLCTSVRAADRRGSGTGGRSYARWNGRSVSKGRCTLDGELDGGDLCFERPYDSVKPW